MINFNCLNLHAIVIHKRACVWQKTTMTIVRRITDGQLDGKLVLQSREAIAAQWLDANITFLRTLHASAENLTIIIEGLEQSGMNPLTLEPLHDAVEGLIQQATLQRLEAMRATTNAKSMNEVAQSPKIRARLAGATNSPAAVSTAFGIIAQRIPQDESADVQAVEATVPLLRAEALKLASAHEAVMRANVMCLAHTALADAADLSKS